MADNTSSSSPSDPASSDAAVAAAASDEAPPQNQALQQQIQAQVSIKSYIIINLTLSYKICDQFEDYLCILKNYYWLMYRVHVLCRLYIMHKRYI